MGPSENGQCSHGEENDHQAPVVDRTSNRMSSGALRREHGYYSGEGADDPGRHMHRDDAQEHRRRRGDGYAKDDYAFVCHGATYAATAPPMIPTLRSLVLYSTGYLQQDFSSCMGGHFTEPNEQKTQQSPGLGFSTEPQLVHS